MTDYGKVVDLYKQYATDTNPNDAELLLGRVPALAALGDLRGKIVVDFGCGPATNGAKLTEAGAMVFGFDADPVVIAEARKIHPQGNYRVNRGLIADELGDKVDRILMSFSFCAIPDREMRYLLRDMRKMLKKNGRLVIVEPNLERSLGIKYRNLHYLPKEGVARGDVVTVMLGSGENTFPVYDIYRRHVEYCLLLREAGFHIEQMCEPKPGRDWDDEWGLEMEYPPFLLIVAK